MYGFSIRRSGHSFRFTNPMLGCIVLLSSSLDDCQPAKYGCVILLPQIRQERTRCCGRRFADEAIRHIAIGIERWRPYWQVLLETPGEADVGSKSASRRSFSVCGIWVDPFGGMNINPTVIMPTTTYPRHYRT